MTSDSPEWGLPKHLTNKQTDLGFLRGRQGYRPHDDDDDEEEDNEVEDNDKDDENDKDNNNDKGISVLGLDRDMGFS